MGVFRVLMNLKTCDDYYPTITVTEYPTSTSSSFSLLALLVFLFSAPPPAISFPNQGHQSTRNHHLLLIFLLSSPVAVAVLIPIPIPAYLRPRSFPIFFFFFVVAASCCCLLLLYFCLLVSTRANSKCYHLSSLALFWSTCLYSNVPPPVGALLECGKDTSKFDDQLTINCLCNLILSISAQNCNPAALSVLSRGLTKTTFM